MPPNENPTDDTPTVTPQDDSSVPVSRPVPPALEDPENPDASIPVEEPAAIAPAPVAPVDDEPAGDDAQPQADEPDSYYGDDDGASDDLDLTFLDEEKQDDPVDDVPKAP